MAKNGHVHDGGKLGRSDATSIDFFSVNSYDLKCMSFRFVICHWFRNAQVKLPVGK
jgi:hypothetical protein